LTLTGKAERGEATERGGRRGPPLRGSRPHQGKCSHLKRGHWVSGRTGGPAQPVGIRESKEVKTMGSKTSGLASSRVKRGDSSRRGHDSYGPRKKKKITRSPVEEGTDEIKIRPQDPLTSHYKKESATVSQDEDRRKTKTPVRGETARKTERTLLCQQECELLTESEKKYRQAQLLRGGLRERENREIDPRNKSVS